MTSRRERVLTWAVLLGTLVVVGTEIESALGALSLRGTLALGAAAAALAMLATYRLPRLPPAGLADAARAWPRLDRALAIGVAAILFLTLLVALMAPPQNPDALAYHMPRVMHWIQNASLDHYPSHDERQLYSPPFGEIVRLHLQLLSGGDRLGELLQWASMVVSLLAVSLLARDLGGRARAQVWAVVIAATIPTGILLASSGKTEWLITLWLLTLAHFLFRLREDGRTTTALLAGTALGLALLTKLTAWFCAGPFLAAFLLAQRGRWRAGLRHTVILAGTAVLLFAPHAARNIRLYGNPIGDAAFGANFEARPVTPFVALSGMARNAALLLETPSAGANALVAHTVERAHRLIGLDAGAPNTTSPPGGFHVGGAPGGDSAGAFGLVIAAALALATLGMRSSPRRPDRLVALAALAVGFVAFSAEVKWQAENGRILLPMLVLIAPVLAAILADAESAWQRGGAAVIGALPLLALPALLGAQSRPLVGAHNVLTTPRRDLLLARCDMRDGYARAAEAIRERGWRTIGLDFVGRIAPCEYALWPLLAAAGAPVRIEHVNVRGPSRRLAESAPWSTFEPDGVLFVRNSEEGRTRFPPALFLRDRSYGLVHTAGALGLYAREEPAERRERLARLLVEAVARLRHRQHEDGSWETLYTERSVFEQPQAETTPYVPWVVADTLAPIAGAVCLSDVTARAREFLRRQGRDIARPPGGVFEQRPQQLATALQRDQIAREAAVDLLDRSVVLGAPDDRYPPVLLYYSLSPEGLWRCHWSVDVGYALWIRNYFEIARRWPESLPAPPRCDAGLTSP